MRVPSGAFVARRNGKVFITGNSGFPKSLDVSKAIDRARDDYEDVCRVALWLRPHVERIGFGVVSAHFGFRDETMARARWTSTSQPNTPRWDQWLTLKDLCGFGDEMDAEVWRLNGRKGKPGDNWHDREVIGEHDAPASSIYSQGLRSMPQNVPISLPATDAAKQWDGWGTALKPAHEPLVLARKPLAGTVAQNILEHGTGGLNIDGCRIVFTSEADKDQTRVPEPIQHNDARGVYMSGTGVGRTGRIFEPQEGRWPANVIHDGSEEVLAAFPDAPGQQGDLNGHSRDRLSKGIFGDMKAARDAVARLDSGSAARFFYCAKASQEDRNEGLDDLPILSAGDVTDRVDGSAGLNSPRAGAGRTNGSRNPHPTVKPTDLMRYLCRLVTPSGGIVLDVFAGSGSTGKAAMLERLRFIGIELSAEYCELAKRRIEAVTIQGDLFANAG